MTFYLHFGGTYDSYELLMSPLEDMLRVEAADPKAAVEQLLRDGKQPENRRLRCVTVISAVQTAGTVEASFGLTLKASQSTFAT